MTNNTESLAWAIIEIVDIDIYDAASLRAYLDDYLASTSPALIPDDLDDQRATLIDAIDADISDYLDEYDLIDADTDIELKSDGGYRRGIATIIANKLLAQI